VTQVEKLEERDFRQAEKHRRYRVPLPKSELQANAKRPDFLIVDAEPC
jgi:hypothetical protein